MNILKLEGLLVQFRGIVDPLELPSCRITVIGIITLGFAVVSLILSPEVTTS